MDKFLSRLAKTARTGEILRLDVAYTALTADIITQYAFARSYDYLDEDDFKLEWKSTILGAFEGGPLLRQFPWLLHLMNSVPDWITEKGNPSVRLLLKWQKDVRNQVAAILDGSSVPESDSGSKTIFHELRDSDLPAEEKTLSRLSDEGEIITGAGSETTA